jgi:hypothetical protein
MTGAGVHTGTVYLRTMRIAVDPHNSVKTTVINQ